jgi:hypothetical protein
MRLVRCHSRDVVSCFFHSGDLFACCCAGGLSLIPFILATSFITAVIIRSETETSNRSAYLQWELICATRYGMEPSTIDLLPEVVGSLSTIITEIVRSFQSCPVESMCLSSTVSSPSRNRAPTTKFTSETSHNKSRKIHIKSNTQIDSLHPQHQVSPTEILIRAMLMKLHVSRVPMSRY